MNASVVGEIKFGNHLLPVYNSLDNPIFRATDISDTIGYSDGNTWSLLCMCEDDEKLKLKILVGGQRREVSFVTEMGLYNILSQSRVPIARMWRNIVHRKLIEMRRERGLNIEEQFDEWDHELDDIYYDDNTGLVMRSVTTAGGDVDQVEFN